MATVYTIGYEGADIQSFLRSLRDARVEVLADVRQVALSRKPGFSKTKLAFHLAGAGVRYVHFRDLGDPKEGRIAAREGRLNDFRRVYSQHLRSAAAQTQLEQLSSLAISATTCLMCFEYAPEHCHRTMICDTLRPLLNAVHLKPIIHANGRAASFTGCHSGEGAPAAQ